MPKLLKPTCPRDRALQQKKPGRCEACALQLEKARTAKHNPSTAKNKIIIIKIKIVLKAFFSIKKEGMDFLLFLHPAIRNLDVMARAQAAILGRKEEGHAVGG